MTRSRQVGRTWRALTLVAAATSLVVGCSSAEPDEGAAPGTTTGPVTVTSDVRFADASPDLAEWSDPLLDVYAPQGGRDLPLVVMLSPHGFTKDNPATVQVANGVAKRGAVVVVANWSQQEDPPEIFVDPAALTAIARAAQSFAGCAIAFAASRAGDFGADPSRVALVGELYGANTASMVALGTPDPYPGCGATTAASSPTVLVGVNDDWLGTAPYFDEVGAAAAAVFSPWALLDRSPTVRTALVVTSDAATLERCDDRDPRDARWMTSRDPTGTMRTRLEAIGAYDDGCVDLGEEAEAMAAEMAAHGLPATVVRLTNPDGGTSSGSGGQVVTFGPADLALLVDTIMSSSRSPGS